MTWRDVAKRAVVAALREIVAMSEATETKVMSERYPCSGLTDDECKELEAAGWRETGFESLPPPWASPDGDLDNPRFALARVRAAKGGA